MTEREEFDRWVRSFAIYDEYETELAWTAWQAARAPRWRSMESALRSEDIYIRTSSCGYVARWVLVEGIGEPSELGYGWMCGDLFIPERKAIAWHPLPDPPTKEELERLKI